MLKYRDVEGGSEAFDAEATFDFTMTKDVETYDSERREVASGVSGPGTAVVLAENDVETPVALIFHAPMLADGRGNRGGIGGETADEEGGFLAFRAIWEAANAVDPGKTANPGPFVTLQKQGEVFRRPAPPYFQSPMPFFDLLETGLLRTGHVVHDGGDDASVRGMVLFDGQNVGAFAVDDGLGGGDLRVERVRRDDGVLQVKTL